MGFLAEIDLEAQPDDKALVFAFHEGRLLVARKDDLAEPVTYGSVAPVLEGAIARLYPGPLDGRPRSPIPPPADPEPAPGPASLSLPAPGGRTRRHVALPTVGRRPVLISAFVPSSVALGRVCAQQLAELLGERNRLIERALPYVATEDQPGRAGVHRDTRRRDEEVIALHLAAAGQLQRLAR